MHMDEWGDVCQDKLGEETTTIPHPSCSTSHTPLPYPTSSQFFVCDCFFGAVIGFKEQGWLVSELGAGMVVFGFREHGCL